MGVAACHIHISILNMQQAVEYINKLINFLNFIKNDIKIF